MDDITPRGIDQTNDITAGPDEGKDLLTTQYEGMQQRKKALSKIVKKIKSNKEAVEILGVYDENSLDQDK